MRTWPCVLMGTLFFACGLCLTGRSPSLTTQETSPAAVASSAYLGFDRNLYPGDAALKSLRQTFSFSGYWLNNPPNETSNTWEGKRQVLTLNGFGFLVLFNGRLDRQLKSPADAKSLGTKDAAAAVHSAMT